MKTLYIDVGCCEVIKDKKCLIKMVLGSCIGIVVYHETSKVVGAIHILLPKLKEIFKNQKKITAFADPGIEYLLQVMKSYTKVINEYKAIIAGGANLTKTEYFNIGEENYKVAKEVLRKFSIKVIYEECLGKYAKILEFDTNKFKYNVSIISKSKYPKEITLKYDPVEIIKDITNVFQYLPVPNKTVLEIIKLNKNDLSLDKLEKIMLKDDFVSINFLKFVNSSYFSPKTKIKDIKQAIVFVGIENVYKFVNILLMQNMVKKDLYSYSIDLYHYKIHVVSVALLSEIIAESSQLNEHIAYIGGLFHDIGKVILDFYALNKFNCSNRYEIITFLEDSIKSTAHAIVGRLYLKNLNLDEAILDIVEYHHFPEYASNNKKLVTAVALANVIIKNFMIGTDSISPISSSVNSKKIFDVLKITEQEMNYILDNVPYLISIAEELVT